MSGGRERGMPPFFHPKKIRFFHCLCQGSGPESRGRGRKKTRWEPELDGKLGIFNGD